MRAITAKMLKTNHDLWAGPGVRMDGIHHEIPFVGKVEQIIERFHYYDQIEGFLDLRNVEAISKLLN